MRFIALVNNSNELQNSWSTTRLIQEAAKRGHEVWLTSVGGLSVAPNGEILAQARAVDAHPLSLEALASAMRAVPNQPVAIRAEDVVLMRTNPARDHEQRWAHESSLGLMCLARERGTLVVNDPDGLIRASSKLYLQYFPEAIRPRTLISRHPAEIINFIAEMDTPAVIKPLSGTWGRDVFMVQSAKDKNIQQIIDVQLRQGFAMVQEFIPEAVAGDTRVVVMNGQILEVGTHAVAINRIPSKSDFRSNVHAGGHAEAATITPLMRQIVAQAGPRLVKDGIFLAGLDIIGSKIIEINVFSTGGIRPAEDFYGVNFSGTVIEGIEALRRDR